MGAVLHCRVCKGCLVGHSHGHLHSCGSGQHSHGHLSRSLDDELLSRSATTVNGYQPLATEDHSDVQLLINEDDNALSTESGGQSVHRTTNVNIRAAMVHVIGDLIQSFGVLTAAIIIHVKVCEEGCSFSLY